MQLFIFIALYASLKKMKFQSNAACSKAKKKIIINLKVIKVKKQNHGKQI